MRRLTLPRRFLFGIFLLLIGLLPPVIRATPSSQTSNSTSVLLVPFGASGAADKVWLYRQGSWVGLTPPAPSMYWLWIAADPVNPHRWLMLGNSIPSNEQFVFAGGQVRMRNGATPPLWFTDTAGASWRPVPLLDSPALTYRFDTVEFDTTQPDSWFLAGLRDTSSSRAGVL